MCLALTGHFCHSVCGALVRLVRRQAAGAPSISSAGDRRAVENESLDLGKTWEYAPRKFEPTFGADCPVIRWRSPTGPVLGRTIREESGVASVPDVWRATSAEDRRPMRRRRLTERRALV
jgi:hypothetical protein